MKPPPFCGKEKLLRKWTLERLWRQDDEAMLRQCRDFLSVFAPPDLPPSVVTSSDHTPKFSDPRDLYHKVRYRSAKESARRGDPKPLGALLAVKLGDPEIGEFIAARRRRQYGDTRARRRQALDTVQRIHRIWREEHPEHKWKRRGDKLAGRGDKLAEKIAAEYCDQTEDEIAEALKRQSRRDAK